VIEVMQDPRLKPVEIPPPARPICTLASLLVSPLADDPRPPYGCRADPVQGAKLHMLSLLCWTLFLASLSGLILVWFGAERNETCGPMRRASFLLNACGILACVGLIFVFPQPLNALSNQKWFFPRLIKASRP
jgi:hypothetical protein